MSVHGIAAKIGEAPRIERFVAAAKAGSSRRAFKIAVTVLLLTALYWTADWRKVGGNLSTLGPISLTLALLLFIPQTVVSALRWRTLVAPLCSLSLLDSVRHTLAASALNLAAPSKLGDFSKAAMLPAGAGARRFAALLVVAEKGADVVALASFCIVGFYGLSGVFLIALALAVVFGISTAMKAIGFRWGRRAEIHWQPLAAWSLVLWTLHLLQIGLFLQAAGVEVGSLETLARVPLAIFAGLLPISFCGIGTRDAALVYLFSDVAPASTMAVVGMLTALRYVIPGAAGIPLVDKAFSAKQLKLDGDAKIAK